jgi:hypothetical protein
MRWLLCAALLVGGVALADSEPMKPEAKSHFDAGIAAYQAGRYDEAIKELTDGKAIDPRPEFDYSLGQSERKRGDCRKANEYFQAYRASILQLKLLEKVGPADKLIDLCITEQIESGRYAHEQGDWAKSAAQYEGAIAQPQYLTKPQLADAYAVLGVDYFQLGRMKEAENAFAELLRLDREHPPTAKCDDRCVELYHRLKNPPEAAPAGPKTMTIYGAARMHLDALLFGDAIALQGGGEVGASYSPITFLDVGAAASIGRNVGGRLSIAFHPSRLTERRVRWYLQVRGVVHPVCNFAPVGCGAGTSVAFGGGLWAGGTIELGPGRIHGGIVGEIYAAPAGYYPYGVLGVIGYELDLLKPRRVVVVK